LFSLTIFHFLIFIIYYLFINSAGNSPAIYFWFWQWIFVSPISFWVDNDINQKTGGAENIFGRCDNHQNCDKSYYMMSAIITKDEDQAGNQVSDCIRDVEQLLLQIFRQYAPANPVSIVPIISCNSSRVTNYSKKYVLQITQQ
jgi:hypothetical protein